MTVVSSITSNAVNSSHFQNISWRHLHETGMMQKDGEKGQSLTLHSLVCSFDSNGEANPSAQKEHETAQSWVNKS